VSQSAWVLASVPHAPQSARVLALALRALRLRLSALRALARAEVPASALRALARAEVPASVLRALARWLSAQVARLAQRPRLRLAARMWPDRPQLASALLVDCVSRMQLLSASLSAHVSAWACRLALAGPCWSVAVYQLARALGSAQSMASAQQPWASALHLAGSHLPALPHLAQLAESEGLLAAQRDR
jgi:hypothetical protein